MQAFDYCFAACTLPAFLFFFYFFPGLVFEGSVKLSKVNEINIFHFYPAEVDGKNKTNRLAGKHIRSHTNYKDCPSFGSPGQPSLFSEAGHLVNKIVLSQPPGLALFKLTETLVYNR